MEDKYLRLRDVLKIVPVSRNTWWKGVKDGRFPQGVKLGKRLFVWKDADVKAVMTDGVKQ